MQVRETPPFAPVLMESTRAIGYSLEAAIADIIDNSLNHRRSHGAGADGIYGNIVLS